MNEQIREIIQSQNSNRGLLWTEEDKEEFAESLIEECVAVLNRRFMGDLNREDLEVKLCIEDVKKHFGVNDGN